MYFEPLINPSNSSLSSEKLTYNEEEEEDKVLEILLRRQGNQGN